MVSWPVLPILFCLLWPVQADKEPVLQTAGEVRELTPEKAGEHHPIEISGVVTLHNPLIPDIFVQDGTSAIYIQSRSMPPGLRPGTRVRIVGESDVGWFSPMVNASLIEVLGTGPLPEPLPFDFSQNDARWMDAFFVQAHCLAREVVPVRNGHRLLVEGRDGTGFVEFNEPCSQEQLQKLIGSVIRVNGVCGPEFDEHGNVTGSVRIMVQTEADITTVQSAERMSKVPIRQAAYLRSFLPGVSPIPFVRMAGTVNAAPGASRLLVQDASGGFSVRLRHPRETSILPGTLVEVAGFLTLANDSVEVYSAEVVIKGEDSLPEPKTAASAAELLASGACRVRIRGTVTESSVRRVTVTGDYGTVIVPLQPEWKLQPGVGAVVSLVGTILVRPDNSTGIRLLMREAGDLRIVSEPPRPVLTGSQLAFLMTLLMSAIALIVGAGATWVIILRKAVRGRTRQLSEMNATLEQRIAERTAELGAANQELEAFCYSVSHDLRAPLRSIDGFSQALEEDYQTRLDEQGKDFLKRVRTAAGRMGELIDDLLNLSRVTRADLRTESVDFSRLAGDIVQELRATAWNHHPECRIAAGLTARGDKSLLRIVLSNLFGNAWKYTSGTPDPKIEFGSDSFDGVVVYSIRDNGAGFDPAYRNKLFQPFQRLHRAEEFPGHGIGLATVLRIVRRHGGQVSASGQPGRGATFRFTLTKHHEGLLDELDSRHSPG